MFAALLWSCEKPTDNPATEDEKGFLTLSITDAPLPVDQVLEANVTIDKVELKRTGDGNPNDSAAFITIMEGEQTFNLLELSNGVTEILAQADIPTGEYDEMRLRIVGAGVILVDTAFYDLEVPSGSSSGLKIKIKPSLTIVNGIDSEALIDFDLNRSFKTIGNAKNKNGIKGFHFSPVVRVVNLTETGEISGNVTNESDEKISDAFITLLHGVDTVTSAFSDGNGFYAMIGIPAGTYQMECIQEDYDTLRVENVQVVANVVTDQNFVLK